MSCMDFPLAMQGIREGSGLCVDALAWMCGRACGLCGAYGSAPTGGHTRPRICCTQAGSGRCWLVDGRPVGGGLPLGLPACF